MVQKLFEKAFSGQRTPRSREYKDGVLAALMFRFDSVTIESPHKPGSVQFDAWRAGIDEGHLIWRRMHQ